MKNVLLISKDKVIHHYLKECIPRGYVIIHMKHPSDLVERKSLQSYDLGIVDTDFFYHDFIVHIRNFAMIPWIALSSAMHFPRLFRVPVPCIKDVVQKPIVRDQFSKCIIRQTIKAGLSVREPAKDQRIDPLLVGSSPAVQEIRHKIRRYAQSDEPVLITGESGTGKEVIAQCMAACCKEKHPGLFPINLAAVPRDLMESTLYGSVAGAYTGAKNTDGLFETCGNGTVFLDEIGEIDAACQAKLLRVIEYGEFAKVGTSKMIKTRGRIITATNRNLHNDMETGRFRQDLYYRIAVLRIHIPPLRERKEDISLLVRHFLTQLECTITPGALTHLQNCEWPGNIRELQNTLRRASVLCSDKEISLCDIIDT